MPSCPFFDWDEEEECELKKLSWNGSWPDTLSNRKHEHLTCLFEAACAVSICPALNVNQNPTSEWELEFCGWLLLVRKHDTQSSVTCDAHCTNVVIVIDHACHHVVFYSLCFANNDCTFLSKININFGFLHFQNMSQNEISLQPRVWWNFFWLEHDTHMSVETCGWFNAKIPKIFFHQTKKSLVLQFQDMLWNVISHQPHVWWKKNQWTRTNHTSAQIFGWFNAKKPKNYFFTWPKIFIFYNFRTQCKMCFFGNHMPKEKTFYTSMMLTYQCKHLVSLTKKFNDFFLTLPKNSCAAILENSNVSTYFIRRF